jgi:hypothetical protein
VGDLLPRGQAVRAELDVPGASEDVLWHLDH